MTAPWHCAAVGGESHDVLGSTLGRVPGSGHGGKGLRGKHEHYMCAILGKVTLLERIEERTYEDTQINLTDCLALMRLPVVAAGGPFFSPSHPIGFAPNGLPGWPPVIVRRGGARSTGGG